MIYPDKKIIAINGFKRVSKVEHVNNNTIIFYDKDKKNNCYYELLGEYELKGKSTKGKTTELLFRKKI